MRWVVYSNGEAPKAWKLRACIIYPWLSKEAGLPYTAEQEVVNSSLWEASVGEQLQVGVIQEEEFWREFLHTLVLAT